MNTRVALEGTGVSSGINVPAFANAAVLVGAVAYILCAAVTAFVPGLYLALIQTWAHGIGVATLQAGAPPMSFGSLAVGLVTFTIFVWLVAAAFAALYDRLSR
jgi:hypothetical protein